MNALLPRQTLAQWPSAMPVQCIMCTGTFYVELYLHLITWCAIIHEQDMKTGEATSSQSDPSQCGLGIPACE